MNEKKMAQALRVRQGGYWRHERELVKDVVDATKPRALASLGVNQLAMLLDVAAHCWWQGRKSVENDAAIRDDHLWVGGDIQRLIPLHLIRRLEFIERMWIEGNPDYEELIADGHPNPRSYYDWVIKHWSISDDDGNRMKVSWDSSMDIKGVDTFFGTEIKLFEDPTKNIQIPRFSKGLDTQSVVEQESGLDDID